MTATLQTGYRSTLASKLEAADTTITVATAPTVTAGRMHLKNGSTHAWIKYTGVTGTTLTGVTFVSQTADPATTVTGVTFPASTSIELVEMHDQMLDKQQGGTIAGAVTINGATILGSTLAITGATTMGSSMKIPVYADASARDAAITSPANGMEVYLTAEGYYTDYQGGVWGTRDTGTVVGNATTTVAGKVELPTTPEMQSNASVGGTGATLSISPAQLGLFYGKGDGSDGTVVFDGVATILGMVPAGNVYTMTRDIYTIDLTVNTGISINPAGYAIYSNGTMTLTGTAKIIRNGVVGGNASGGTPGTPGTALATGTCGANLAGQAGGATSTAGGNGVAVSPSYATTSTASVAGGAGGAGLAGGAGAGGTSAIATQGALYNTYYSLANLLGQLMLPARSMNTSAYGGLPSSGGGGGGGINGAGTAGAGGGSGSNGGIIMIFANVIAGSGTIEAVGGAGGNGGNAVTGGGFGGGGGGSGGNGGIVVLVYNSGTPWTRTLTGGAAGTGGTATGGATAGSNGSAGTVGQSIIINV